MTENPWGHQDRRRNRPRPRPRGPRPLMEGLDRVAGSLGLPPSGALSRLTKQWPEIVGQAVAENASPRSLRGGVLVLTVADPVWATQLRWLEADLLARVREAVGPGVVERVTLRVARET